MKTVIVLVMHGMPPVDFPREELTEFFKLHSIVETRESGNQKTLHDHYAFLADKIRNWPRNEQNDPFYAASGELAAHLSQESGHEVILGYFHLRKT